MGLAQLLIEGSNTKRPMGLGSNVVLLKIRGSKEPFKFGRRLGPG